MYRLGQNTSALLLYCALVVLVFTGVITGRGVFFAGDISQHYVPWETAVDEEIESGNFPQWENGFFCGHPIHAEGQSGILYPVTRIAYRFFDGARGFSIDMLIHLVLGGFFLYLLGRRIGLGYYSSLYAGAVYTLAGYPVCLIVNAPILRSAAWVPIIVLLTWSVWRGNRLRSSLFLTVCLALQILAGSIQIVAITLMLVLFMSIYMLIDRIIKKQPVVAPALILGLIAIPLAFLIASAQIMPSLELYQKSFIHLDSTNESTSYSFSPYHLLDLVIPPYWAQSKEILGNDTIPFQMTLFLYIGTIPFIMALIGFVMSKSSWLWRIIAIIGILIGLGGYTFFYPLLLKIMPLLSGFRAPDRFLVFYAISASLLAGYGFRYFLGKELPADPEIKRKSYFITGIIVMILLIGALLVDRFLPQTVESIYTDLRFSVFNIISLASVFSNLSQILSAAKLELIIAGFLIGLLIAASVQLRNHPSRVAVLGVIIFVLGLCEVGYYLKMNPGTRLINPDYYTTQPASVQAIHFSDREGVPLIEQSGQDGLNSNNNATQTVSRIDPDGINPYRISILGSYDFAQTVFGNTPLMLWYHGGATIEDFIRFREILNPNFGNNYGLNYVSGISSLYTSSFDKFMLMYEHQEKVFLSNPDYFRTRVHLWDLCGVKYVISNVQLPEGRLELRHRGEVYVYENKRAQPRAFVLYPEKVVPETPHVMHAFTVGDIDPVRNLILETGKEIYYQREPMLDSTYFSKVEIEKYQNGMVEISGIAVTDGYLILTDSFYPGWECRINDEKKQIYRAYGYFRAVPVKAGPFNASFQFKPKSFRNGLIMSSIGILLWIAMAFVSLTRKDQYIEEPDDENMFLQEGEFDE
ncbi:hypothetical protein J7L05_01195 [bacterium]|nr:hypothetical protein [bacterium]